MNSLGFDLTRLNLCGFSWIHFDALEFDLIRLESIGIRSVLLCFSSSVALSLLLCLFSSLAVLALLCCCFFVLRCSCFCPAVSHLVLLSASLNPAATESAPCVRKINGFRRVTKSQPQSTVFEREECFQELPKATTVLVGFRAVKVCSRFKSCCPVSCQTQPRLLWGVSVCFSVKESSVLSCQREVLLPFASP